MLNKESTIKAVQLVEYLHKEVDKKNIKSDGVMIITSNEESMHLANLRDYFMFFAFEATKEEAENYLSWSLHQYLKEENYTLFFFAIEQILILRHKIQTLPMEDLSKEVFLKSFKETKERYKLKEK